MDWWDTQAQCLNNISICWVWQKTKVAAVVIPEGPADVVGFQELPDIFDPSRSICEVRSIQGKVRRSNYGSSSLLVQVDQSKR
jgi:hypothetical protein